MTAYALTIEHEELLTYQKVVNDSNSSSWRSATEKEMESLHKNDI